MSRGFRDADVTSELSEKAASDLLQRVREEEAARAQHAAERRASGGYDVCEDCGGAIGAERLEFMRDATRCVSCQSAHDRRR